MMLPQGAMVAVADGEILNMFQNVGDEAALKLTALPHVAIDGDTKGSGARHQSSSGNPDNSQAEEDGFSAGIIHYLNRRALDGHISALVIIAAPRTLGEMRKHWHASPLVIASLANLASGRFQRMPPGRSG
jgi:protein required for attachment to host cells